MIDTRLLTANPQHSQSAQTKRGRGAVGRGRAALCGTRGESQSQGAAPIQGPGPQSREEPPVQTGPACPVEGTGPGLAAPV